MPNRNKNRSFLFFFRHRPFLVVSLALWMMTGCTNLKQVQQYSSKAAQSVRHFEAIQYSFTQSCQERCVTAQLEKKALSRTDCDCQLEQRADSATLLLYSAVKAYFDGLARLSGTEVTDYSFTPLATSLTAGNFGAVQVTEAQAQSYANIAGVLSRAITDGYRQKKIGSYIGQANNDIKTLLQALQFTLTSNLAGRLETRRSRLRSFYFDLAGDLATSAYERKNIIEEYGRLTAEIDDMKRQLQSYARGLDVIARGHQQLYENRDKLTVPQVKEALSQYAGNLQYLMDEFNKLKNQH